MMFRLDFEISKQNILYLSGQKESVVLVHLSRIENVTCKNMIISVKWRERGGASRCNIR